MHYACVLKLMYGWIKLNANLPKTGGLQKKRKKYSLSTQKMLLGKDITNSVFLLFYSVIGAHMVGNRSGYIKRDHCFQTQMLKHNIKTLENGSQSRRKL